jgi:hypothetical protein
MLFVEHLTLVADFEYELRQTRGKKLPTSNFRCRQPLRFFRGYLLCRAVVGYMVGDHLLEGVVRDATHRDDAAIDGQ